MFVNDRTFCLGRFFRRNQMLRAGALLLAFGTTGFAAAATLCVNPGGTSGCESSINAAVAAASNGDTIMVAPGTYKEDVQISKSISLIAEPGTRPVIDAMGLDNGINVDGMSAAPGIGVANVVIAGFRVENANYEGILVTNGYDITIRNNQVFHNNQLLDAENAICPDIGSFETNEGFDCGEGIHLMGTDHVSVIGNEMAYNAGGILISDETGPAENNLISDNNIHDNPYDCGITLASHGPSPTITSATGPYGVMRNTIADNTSAHNGYAVFGAGAGVGIFAPFPGTVNSGNVVIGNNLLNNGLPGVALHNHAAAPVPGGGVNMNDNVIVDNHFSGNGADTEDAATPGPTGINVFSNAAVIGTVIAGNVFQNEAVDVAFKAPGGEVSAHMNNFNTHGMGVDNLGTGMVNATENWWHCPHGPGAAGCSTAMGNDVMTSPWLTTPVEPSMHNGR